MAKQVPPPSDLADPAEFADPGDLGVFDPAKDAAPAPVASYTIPELVAFRDNPTRDTHLAAARLLHRTGELTLDGDNYKLMDGRVVRYTPRRNPYEVVLDDPKEVI